MAAVVGAGLGQWQEPGAPFMLGRVRLKAGARNSTWFPVWVTGVQLLGPSAALSETSAGSHSRRSAIQTSVPLWGVGIVGRTWTYCATSKVPYWFNILSWKKYSYPLLFAGSMLQDPHWIFESKDGNKPCMYCFYVLCYTYITSIDYIINEAQETNNYLLWILRILTDAFAFPLSQELALFYL